MAKVTEIKTLEQLRNYQAYEGHKCLQIYDKKEELKQYNQLAMAEKRILFAKAQIDNLFTMSNGCEDCDWFECDQDAVKAFRDTQKRRMPMFIFKYTKDKNVRDFYVFGLNIDMIQEGIRRHLEIPFVTRLYHVLDMDDYYTASENKQHCLVFYDIHTIETFLPQLETSNNFILIMI